MATSIAHRRRLATQRKRRERAKNKGSFRNLSVKIPASLKDDLELLVMLNSGKTLEDVVTKALVAFQQEQSSALAPVERLAKAYWPKIRAYLPYSRSLIKPGTMIRIGSTEYKADEWLKLQPVWAQMIGTVKALGVKDALPFFDLLTKPRKPAE